MTAAAALTITIPTKRNSVIGQGGDRGSIVMNSDKWLPWLALLYEIGSISTFVKLTFFDGYSYNAWNWLIAIPVNFFSATFGQSIGAFCAR